MGGNCCDKTETSNNILLTHNEEKEQTLSPSHKQKPNFIARIPDCISKVSFPTGASGNRTQSLHKDYGKKFSNVKINVEDLYKYEFNKKNKKVTKLEASVLFPYIEEEKKQNGEFTPQLSMKSVERYIRKPSFTLDITPKEFRIEKVGQLQEKYEVLDLIGKGGYGEVKKLQNKITKNVVALKTILKSKCQMTKHFVDEIHILQKLDHPNIVRFFEFYVDSLYYYLITEFCPGGDLMKIMTKEQHFSERKASEIMYQVFSGVEYCHRRNIVHRDLKPENIVFNDYKGTLKIIDFGRSTILKPAERLTEKVGTLYYVAPEIILNKRYNEKCDIWSCGVMLYLMISGFPPFYGLTRQETIYLIVNGPLRFSEPVWEKISEECKSLIRATLFRDVDKRISASQALNHKWIRKSRLTSGITGKEVLLSLHNLRNFRIQSLLEGAVLSYIASQEISQEEDARIRELFDAFDSNKDGELSKDELVRALQYIYGDSKRVHEDAELILNNLDLNHNGAIEYNEFVMANMKLESRNKEEVLKNAFDFYDRDHNGQITIEEIKHVFGNICDEGTLHQIIAEVDTDNDHQISFEEFKSMMARYERSHSFRIHRSYTEEYKQ